VLRAVNHPSPGLQGRPGATRNAPCSILIHHDWPLMSHQASTAPIVGTSHMVVAGWRQRPRVRRRHISRGSSDQKATHPWPGPALSSAVAHRTARVPERMATSSRRRAGVEPSALPLHGAQWAPEGIILTLDQCSWSVQRFLAPFQNGRLPSEVEKRNHHHYTEACFPGVRRAITWGA
jgi:hypothetical protein